MNLAQADQILVRGMILPLPSPQFPWAVVDQKNPGQRGLNVKKRQ